jgi:hypothetical protein
MNPCALSGLVLTGFGLLVGIVVTALFFGWIFWSITRPEPRGTRP